MKRLLLIPALTVILAAGAGTAAAELVLEAVGWQSGRVERPPRPAVFADATTVVLPAKGAPRVRAKAVLKNRGPKSMEGILLRYVVSARLLPLKAEDGEGSWAVPFLVEERRVPKIGANKILEVPLITSPLLEQYLRRVARQGFRADRLRLQAMIEPHPDQDVRTVSAELEVAK